MIRGGSNGLRAHFTRGTISACRLPQREQTSANRVSRIWPVPEPLGIGADRRRDHAVDLAGDRVSPVA